MPKKAHAQAWGERAAAESYEKRQMLWKGMAGRGWTELVQQWGVPQVEALQLQKSIASLMKEVWPKLGGLHWKESTGLGKESRVLSEEALSEHAGGSQGCHETEGTWLVWREGSREVDCEETAAVGSQGAGYKQKGPGLAVWGHSRLGTEGGNGEEDG